MLTSKRSAGWKKINNPVFQNHAKDHGDKYVFKMMCIRTLLSIILPH